VKQYQIGAVAKLTGLTVHNLRVWEKRHSAVDTQRTDSGHRVYSEEALERLKLLKRCVDNGMSISSVAALRDDELREIIAETAQTNLSRPADAVNVALVATDWFDKVQHRLDDKVEWGLIQQYESLTQLRDSSLGSQVDLLVLNLPSITAAEVKPMGQLIKQINARVTLLAYRYARQQDIIYFRTLGVSTLKSPLDHAEVAAIIERKFGEPTNGQNMLPVRQAPPRKFDDQLLQKAASVSSSIDCECPQHLAEIIQGLTAFEHYSAQCESKDKAGEDLHRHIHLRTGQARAVMEELLQSVLQQEGIDLSLIRL
jgi:DNA-binding transcriptional MerR regulator